MLNLYEAISMSVKYQDTEFEAINFNTIQYDIRKDKLWYVHFIKYDIDNTGLFDWVFYFDKEENLTDILENITNASFIVSIHNVFKSGWRVC